MTLKGLKSKLLAAIKYGNILNQLLFGPGVLFALHASGELPTVLDKLDPAHVYTIANQVTATIPQLSRIYIRLNNFIHPFIDPKDDSVSPDLNMKMINLAQDRPDQQARRDLEFLLSIPEPMETDNIRDGQLDITDTNYGLTAEQLRVIDVKEPGATKADEDIDMAEPDADADTDDGVDEDMDDAADEDDDSDAGDARQE